ncbi:unnamed protein product [Brassica oleracea]
MCHIYSLRNIQNYRMFKLKNKNICFSPFPLFSLFNFSQRKSDEKTPRPVIPTTLRLLLALPSGVASSSWWSAGFWLRSTSAPSMFRQLLVLRLAFPCGVDDDRCFSRLELHQRSERSFGFSSIS